MPERPSRASGEDRSVALAFVNTLTTGPNGPSDAIGDPGSLARWLTQHGTPFSACVEQDVADAHHLRAAIRSVLAASGSSASLLSRQVDAVNEAAARSPGAPQLTMSADPAERLWWTANTGIEEALAALARDAITMAASPEASRIHTCAAGDCVRLFLAERSTRTWCSTACGNRVRAARHYARTIQKQND